MPIEVRNIYPADNSTNIPIWSNICFALVGLGVSVDISTLVIEIDTLSLVDATTSTLTITPSSTTLRTSGTVLFYEVEVNSPQPFEYEQEVTIKHFYDPEKGAFFFTADDGEKLLVRNKNGYDNARPSGNGVMASNLLRIADLTGDLETRARADKTLDFFGGRLSYSALGFGAILNAFDYRLQGGREIFIAGPPVAEGTRKLVEAIWRDPDPNRVLALVTPQIEQLLPPAKGKTLVDGKPAAYVCRDFTCNQPVTDPAELKPATIGK